MVENKDLRRCLFRMQRQLESLLRIDLTSQRLHDDDLEDDLPPSEDEEPWLQSTDQPESGLESAGLLQLPFDLLRADLERGLRDSLKQLRSRISSQKSPTAAEEVTKKEEKEEAPRKEPPSMRLAWEEVEQLKGQVAEYERVIEGQEALLKVSKSECDVFMFLKSLMICLY